jgi:YegS/Rv2252/BmrU family lipid kinase
MISPHAVLVVNTGSRTGQDVFDQASRHLEDLGLPLAQAHAVTDPATLPDVLDDVLASGASMIVLAGGDGTLSTAADRLSQTGVVLGVLPTGTANDFARTLRLPTDLAAACETVVNGQVTDVDLGAIGDDRFLNVASVGLSVGVTQVLSPKLKRSIGALAYPVAVIKAYRQHRTFAARLEFPAGDHDDIELGDLLQLAVANGRFYGGGAVVAPDAGIDDHLLDVYAIPYGTAWQRLTVARHFVSGAFTEQDHVLHLTTREVRLTTTPELAINVDGEVGLRTPQTFRMIAGGLKVMVPKD